MSPRAPKVCGAVDCFELVPNGVKYCDQHARRQGKWPSKTGTTPRTATTDHKGRRERILKRDRFCQLRFENICTGLSVICDHIVPIGAADFLNVTEEQLDTDDNCQGVCEACSGKKTSQEGHYLAGHKVPCPWTAADVANIKAAPPQPIKAARPAIPRVIHAKYEG